MSLPGELGPRWTPIKRPKSSISSRPFGSTGDSSKLESSRPGARALFAVTHSCSERRAKRASDCNCNRAANTTPTATLRPAGRAQRIIMGETLDLQAVLLFPISRPSGRPAAQPDGRLSGLLCPSASPQRLCFPSNSLDVCQVNFPLRVRRASVSSIVVVVIALILLLRSVPFRSIPVAVVAQWLSFLLPPSLPAARRPLSRGSWNRSALVLAHPLTCSS